MNGHKAIFTKTVKLIKIELKVPKMYALLHIFSLPVGQTGVFARPILALCLTPI